MLQSLKNAFLPFLIIASIAATLWFGTPIAQWIVDNIPRRSVSPAELNLFMLYSFIMVIFTIFQLALIVKQFVEIVATPRSIPRGEISYFIHFTFFFCYISLEILLIKIHALQNIK